MVDMKPVGIIANPNSGKDIRRLVAHGSVFGNHEKVHLLRRLLLAMDAGGVREVIVMPDTSRMAWRALDGLELTLKVSLLGMEARGEPEDSTQAARMLTDLDVACIVTLGGDGTNRVVAKGCGDTPLLPLSTGTNNVFPFTMESTVAGMTAAFMARGSDADGEATVRFPRLEIWRDSQLVDISLVDVVVTDDRFLGARAVWEESRVREIFLARSRPDQIGFSAVGGMVRSLPAGGRRGLHILLGPGGEEVMAPIAPGLVKWLPILSHRVFQAGEEVCISTFPSMLALDGEREIEMKRGDSLGVRINPSGPVVVDPRRALRLARKAGFFVRSASRKKGK
jgi:predicted polyphosphate/ATP-dependent NAD kinase